MEQYKKLKSDDLQKGMIVAREIRPPYGWRAVYRHPIWEKTSIERITPKRTKAVLKNGVEISLRNKFPEPNLFEYEETMEKETEIAKMFEHTKHLQMRIGQLGPSVLASLSDEDLAEVHAAMETIYKIVKKGET